MGRLARVMVPELPHHITQRGNRRHWSSASVRVLDRDHPLLTQEPLQTMVDEWRDFLAINPVEETLTRLYQHSRTGRTLGSKSFLQQLEGLTGRILLPQKRGPKSQRIEGEN